MTGVQTCALPISEEGRNREAIVDRLYEAAKARGKIIERDKQALGMGDSITKFMQRIGKGKRVFVVLSDKYLKSPFCMYELWEVWRNARQQGEAFIDVIRVFALPDAKIFTPRDRLLLAAHWKKETEELAALVKEVGPELLGERDGDRLRMMRRFSYDVSDILATIADRVLPRSFEDFEKYGFDEPGKT